MTTRIELSIVIDRPIEDVFKNATCLKGCVNWQTAVISAEKVDANRPTEVGTRFHHLVKFMGKTQETHPEVIRYDPPREFAYSDSDARIPFETRFLFKEVEDGTELTVIVTGDVDHRVLGRIAQPIMQRALARQFDTDLHSLKDLLENDIAVHAP